MNYFFNDVEINTECQCLSDNCQYKRIIKFTHPITLDSNSLTICNEFFRLKFHEKKNESKCSYRIKEKVIIDIVSDVFNLDRQRFTEYANPSIYSHKVRGDISNFSISLMVVNRPSIFYEYTIFEAIELYFSTKNKKLFEIIKYNIIEYFRINTYKKYRTKYEKVVRLLKNIERTFSNEEIEILFNEIMILLLELNFKLKKLEL